MLSASEAIDHQPAGIGPGRVDRWWLVLIPCAFLLAAFGRLVADPSALLVAADRPTVDRARVVDAPPGNDLTRQFLPLHRWIGAEWRQTGRLPTWDDRGFGGRPLVGNPQAGLFYPPVWFAWLIPAPAMLGWITLGHLLWGLLGTDRLTKTLGMGGLGRMVAAGCFAFNPYVLAQVAEGHYPHIWAVAWYPWAFDALSRIERRSALWAGQLVASLAATILVGHPQEGYYLLIAGGVWAVVAALVRWRRSGDRAASRLVRFIAAGGLLGLVVVLLTAVETIPAQRVAAFGLRSERPSSRAAGQYHPSALNLVQVLSPGALGGPHDYFGPDNYWETLLGAGLIPLVLAGVGVVGASAPRRTAGWVALVVGSVLFAFGRSGGLFPLLFAVVPGMDRFRVPARSLFLAALGMAVLAGFGVEILARQQSREREDRATSPDAWQRWLGRWVVALVLLAVALIWGTARTKADHLTPEGLAPTVRAAVEHDPQTETRHHGGSDRDRVALTLARLTLDPVFGLAVGGLTLGLVVGVAQTSARRGVAVGWGLLALAELAGSGFRLLPTAPASAFVESGVVARSLAPLAPRPANQPRPVIRADPGIVSDLEALALGLAKTDINDSFQIAHAAQVYGHLYELSRPRPEDHDHPAHGPLADARRERQAAILTRLGVAGLAADASTPRALALMAALPWPTLPLFVAHNRRVVVAHAPDPLPWAYVVPQAQVVAEDDSAIVAEFAATDPRSAALMTADPLRAIAPDRPRQAFRAAERVTLNGADRIAVEVTTTAPGLLVLRQPTLPGWSATVDGHSAAIECGNVAQQVIALPEAGRHQVRLRYDPPGLALGLALSAGGLVAWLALGWMSWRGAKSRRPLAPT